MPYGWNRPAKVFPDNPYGSRFVPGEGPVPCDWMLIGEGPGVEENRVGRPFIGKSGQFLNQFLMRDAGRMREDVYVTNIVKYHMPGDADPTTEDIERDKYFLAEEIGMVQPKFIGLVGAVAARFFLGKSIHMEWAHGLPFPRGRYTFVPIYHPAFGLRSPDMMALVQDDFRQFGLIAKGKIKAEERKDDIRAVYTELRDDDHGPTKVRVAVSEHEGLIAIDTEGYWYDPWCLSFCTQYGRGYVIWKDSPECLQSFQAAIDLYAPTVLLHNSLHDLEVLQALGVTIGRFIDTMEQAYLLCLEPQGLKPLSRRHCGMEMSDFDEIMKPAMDAKAIDYLMKLEEWCQSNPSVSGLLKSSKTRKKKK